MKTVVFMDLDNTLVTQGTQNLYPGVKERVDKLASEGCEIWFFSCWAFNDRDMKFLQETFPYMKGVIKKPLADKYLFVDDKHDTGLSKAIFLELRP